MILPAPRVLALADSDSYVKWAAGTLDRLPPAWRRDLVLVRSPIAPSPAQVAAAVAGTRSALVPPRALPAPAVRRLAQRVRPDVVLAACTGPVVDVLLHDVLADLHPRPVLVSGLPGISVPATARAWLYRSAVDLFVLHSRREVREFRLLGEQMGVRGEVGLARLPFLDDLRVEAPRPPARGAGAPPPRRVVFAPQAKVPVLRGEREQVLRALAGLAHRYPDVLPVVKLRALRNEQQTHREPHPYDDLWDFLVRRSEVPGGAVAFEVGPMAAHLAAADAFVTVSSTAALEAIARGRPLLVLSDFGVSEAMINLVFEGSGCLGTLEDLAAARFRHPESGWRADNYFHPAEDDDWVERLSVLVEKSRAGALPPAESLPVGARQEAARSRARRRLAVHPDALVLRNAAGRQWRRLRGLRRRRHR